MALAQDLKSDDSGRSRCAKRLGMSRAVGNSERQVGPVAERAGHAALLASDQQKERLSQPAVVNRRGDRGFIRAGNHESMALRDCGGFLGAFRQRCWEHFRSARRCTRHNARRREPVARTYHEPGCSGGVQRPQGGAEVVRIFDTVDHDEPSAGGPGAGGELFDGYEPARAGQRCDAAVALAGSDRVDFGRVDAVDWDGVALSFAKHALDRRVLLIGADEDLRNRTAPENNGRHNRDRALEDNLYV